MKRAGLLVLVLAACGDDGGNAGMDGSLLRPDADNDLDFDGVPDDVDNCPQSVNGFQSNEDGDKFGDACDPCPHVADDNPANSEMAPVDSVADACDPKPLTRGDEIVKFEGFGQGKPSGWDETGATWGAANGALTANITGTGSFALILTDRTRETVSAEITVVSTTGATSEVGLVDNKMQNGTPAVACVLTGSPAVVSVYATNDTAGAVTTTFELAANATYLMTLQRENNAYTCTAKNVATNATATATKSITLPNDPYLSGLRVTDANVRVKWFMLVNSQ